MQNEKNDLLIPELLAPAGSLQAGITAFENGADAVFCGLPKFNARERGENFSFNDLAHLIAYSKRYNKRVHVTLNTLIKPDEMEEVIEMLGKLSLLSPDAIIVQDLGLIQILRKFFPNLEIHASTQMGQHNSLGSEVLSSLSVKRIILERQTTFKEIEVMNKNTRLPIETFVHGALCCCRSGSCLFSSWLGGWSGNRGKCKQPCRRRYFSKQGNGFFFSPGDLCLIEQLPELIKLGVASLKIEGRLRGSDYVANVVSAYRKVLDVIAKEGINATKQINIAVNEAKKILSGSLGRRWSEGFISLNNMQNIMQYKQLSGSGKPCGQVVSQQENGFNVKLTSAIAIGERIRIQPRSGDDGPSLIINKLIVDKKSVPKAFPNENVFIPYHKQVPAEGSLYLVANVAPAIKHKIDLSQNIELIIPLNFAFSASLMTISSPLLPKWKYIKDINLQPAQKHGISSAKIVEEWHKGTGENWRIGDITVSEESPLFLPGSEIRKLRQNFYQEMEDIDLVAMAQENANEICAAATNSIKRKNISDRKQYQSVIYCKEKPMRTGKNTKFATDLAIWKKGFEEAVLPPFCPEDKIKEIRLQVKKAYEQGCRTFRITSLWQIALFNGYNPRPELIASFPLPVCNNPAIDLLQSLRVNTAMIWVELNKESAESLIEDNKNSLELMTYGRLPLLETRADIAVEGVFKDSFGHEFFIKNEQELSKIYSQDVFNISSLAGATSFIDIVNASQNESKFKDFNFNYDFV